MSLLAIASTAFAFRNTMTLVTKVTQALVDPINNIEQRQETDRINSSTYGRPIPVIFGPRNRIAGNMIWASDIRTRKRTRKKTNGIAPSTYTVTYSYDVDVAFAISESITNLSRIWANGKLLFEQASVTTIPATGQYFAGGNGKPYSSIRVYPGSTTQPVDPTISAAKGAGNAPAYRGTAYVVITGLDVKNSGLGIPNFEFEVSGSASETVSSILNSVCTRAGMSADEFQIDSGLTDTVDGFVVSRQTDAIRAVTPLATTFAFDPCEHSGVIRFVERGHHITATIELDEMAAGNRSGNAGKTIETVRAPDYELPKTATLTYIDYVRDYQENTQSAFRGEGAAETDLNVSVGVTLDSALARKIVDRILWEPWIGRVTSRILLSDKYAFLKPADVIAVPLAGGYSPFRIDRRTRGADGVIELECVLEDPYIYDGATADAEAVVPDNTEQVSGDTFVYVYNAPIMGASESAAAFSWAADAADDVWEGGEIMRANAVGGEFSTLAEFNVRNTTGAIATATPAATTADVWDRKTIITVVLTHDAHELVSAAEIDVLNGDNMAWIGAADGSHGEVIQFATATLTNSSPKTYELTDLLRGRRGTEHEMSLHGSNEVFVLYEGGLMQTSDLTATDWDREREYKGVSIYQDETDVTETQAFTNLGEKSKPRSPVHGRGARDSSNNLTITWKRRTRGFAPGIGYGSVALDEAAESYQIDIMSGSTVLRTITTTTTSASYTAAQQTADGLTPGNTVSIRIYQMSAARGRGHAGVFIV